jgi:hypothetical protein
MDRLFSEPNNLIEHIIKLWTMEFKTNVFGTNLISNNVYNNRKFFQKQSGGKYNKNYYKIKII